MSLLVPKAIEAKPRCWVCDSQGVLPWRDRTLQRSLRPDDLCITDHHYGQTLALRRCNNCGFIFADDQELSQLVGLYERLSDPEYVETQDSRRRQMAWLVQRAMALRPHARTALDVGAATGLLVQEACRLGLQAIGVEPSRRLVEVARHSHGLEVLQGTFPHPGLCGRKFDLVFLIDVIEHVSNPVELLRACGDALAGDGILVVVTPDVSSVAARLLKRRWWHFRLAHVCYFNPQSFAVLAQAAQLQIVRVARAKWFFEIGYVAQRLAEYLPVNWINRRALDFAPGRQLYDHVVTLNLHDSSLFLLARPSKELR